MADLDRNNTLIADSTGPSSEEPVSCHFRKRNAVLFGVVAAIWLVIDQLTKVFFNAYELGEVVAGPFLGIFRFRIVHNTGAAWSLFSDSTFALGVFSVVVCLLLLVYLFKLAPDSSLGETFALALVFSGGLGNAIDRFALGYVVDFIEPVFIEFPVFNVADIGVTCGFAIFLVLMFVNTRKAS